ncbi:MAG: hypothetical protein SVM79_03145 [Chloroflexota bacterium]|nr:hypothetical protein [Chloroflexota bacterium]
MVNIQLDSARLQQAKDLFILGDDIDYLLTSLEGLGAKLGIRWASFQQFQQPRQAIPNKEAKAKSLSDAINYASHRLTDVLARLQEIEWKKEVLSYETNLNVSAMVSDPWRMFMGLAVKDFHLDITSLIDSLAPVIIQADSELKNKDRIKFPSWADIQNNSKRSYRQQLSDTLRKIVDDTDRWFINIKNIRDLLTHREHDRIIFGNSKNGILFQINDQSRSATILLPAVLYQEGYNVVDFDLYCAFILAEVVLLFDDLGKAIAPRVPISNNDIAKMSYRGVNKSVAQSIERLIQSAR